MPEEIALPFRGIYWDDAQEQLPWVRAAYLLGHARVEYALKDHVCGQSLSLKALTDIHGVLFGGVWPEFAGKLRGPAPQYLPVQISFGKYRAVPLEQVPGQCAQLFDTLSGLIAQLDEMKNDVSIDDFQGEIFKVASYVHCELIRIHPFVNGNGRTSRMCINYFAWRYGFVPVSYDRPGDATEYLAANGTWLEKKRIDHFVSLLRSWCQEEASAK